MNRIRKYIISLSTLRDHADLEKIILEFDNGHDAVFWNDEYKFKMKKHGIKWKRRKEVEEK